MLVYHYYELVPLWHMNLDFQSNKDSRKSTFGFVFTLGSEVVNRRNVKQSCIVGSIMEAQYIAFSEEAKETI